VPTGRILVLESLQDGLTNHRAWRIRSATGLKGFVIEHCYALGITEDEQEVRPDC
jgi:hypothetical protein